MKYCSGGERMIRSCTWLAGMLWLAATFALAEPKPVGVSWPEEAWVRSTPAAEGLDAEAIAGMDADIQAGKLGNVDSMTIIRHGRVVFEGRYKWDYRAQHQGLVHPSPPPWDYFNAEAYPWHEGSTLHTMQSVTKSVMSALIGIAIERGDLPGLDATLGELLPHRNITDPEIRAIRLENVLTMTAGIDWEEANSYFDLSNDATASEATDDWVGFLLAKPVGAPQGTVFDYNTAASQMLSELLTVATGIPTNLYAERYLFDPIGITNYFWNTAPEGYINAGSGLFLAAEDLARFALLYAQKGQWRDQQVIPVDWIERSSTAWIPVEPDDEAGWGYGYQWWIYRHAGVTSPKMYGGWGWGGQFPLIVPELGLVAVFTGWNIREDIEYPYAFDAFYDRLVTEVDR